MKSLAMLGVCCLALASSSQAALVGEALYEATVPLASTYQFTTYTSGGSGAITAVLGAQGTSQTFNLVPTPVSNYAVELLDGFPDRMVFQLNQGPASSVGIWDSEYFNDTVADRWTAHPQMTSLSDFFGVQLDHFTLTVQSKALGASSATFELLWQAYSSAGSGVPEPGTLGLAVLGMVLGGRRWRR